MQSCTLFIAWFMYTEHVKLAAGRPMLGVCSDNLREKGKDI